jgi:hypothetical protein
MDMTTGIDTSTLRKNSPLFWCALLVPSAIIAIGINFILNPVGASTAFGIPIHDPTAFPFMWILLRKKSEAVQSCSLTPRL